MKSKKILLFIFLYSFAAFITNAQTQSTCGDTKSAQKIKPQKIGIVITSNDPETVWNAFRLANYSVDQGDTVSVFLLGKGVESPDIISKDFDVKGMMETYSNSKGKLLACGTCLQLRHSEGSRLCPVSSLDDLYAIIKMSNIMLTF